MRLSRLDVAVVGLFLANGLSVGAWVGSLPALRERFGLSALGVAGLLLAAGACAMTTMLLVGRSSERVGARRWALLSPVLMAVGLAVVVLAPQLWLVAVGAALYGVGNGAMDVAMNAVAVHVEQRESSTRMGLYHGTWSLGSFLAAGIVYVMGLTGWAALVWPPVLACAALAAVLLGAVARLVPETAPTHDEHAPRGRLPRLVWLLAAMAVCFGLTEGSGFDWASLHTAEVAQVPASTGALGLAAVSACMVASRFGGDAMVRRWGRAHVVLGGAATAAVGYLITVAAPLASGIVLPVVLVGWAVVGLGVGVVAPQIYGAAGHLGGPRVLSVVVAFGYGAFLTCPAIIGSLAGLGGLRWAMLLPTVAAVLLVALSSRLSSAA